MYAITYTKTALKDIPKLKAAHLDEKAKELINIIRNNPYQIPPDYEKLTGDLYGLYSRRINRQHRLVYEILQMKIEQLSNVLRIPQIHHNHIA